MRCISTVVPLLLASLAASQTVLVFGDNALPACAQSCQLLQQAQNACVPPAAAVTDQTTYESCFCQSGYLNTLRTSASGTCDSVCPAADDQRRIQSWYLSNCQNNGANVAAGQPRPTTASNAPTVASVASTSTGTSPVPTGSSSGSGAVASASPRKQSWWDGHWKWVIMIIVLVIAFVAMAIVGVLLKRRHDRKQDKIKSGFNAGITHRSVPMTTTPGPLSHHDYGPQGGRGGTPAPGSAMYLPNVRERDRKAVQQKNTQDVGVFPLKERGYTPTDDSMAGGKLEKGKQRSDEA